MEDESIDVKTGLLWMGESRSSHWIRDGWEQAKKENRLTGCGLMGEMTMDDIEDLEVKVKEAMTTWARLAGCKPECKKDLAIDQLTSDIEKLTKELSELRKHLDLEIALRDMAKELKNAK